MAQPSLKRLYQGTPTTESVVYTAASRVRVDRVRVSAATVTSGTYSLSVVPGGGTDAGQTHRVATAVTATQGDPVTDDLMTVLEVGDTLSAICSAGLVMTITGVTNLP